MAGDLKIVRALVRNPQHLSPAVMALLDHDRRAFHDQAKNYRLDPTNEKFEIAWMIAGSAAGRLLSNPDVWAMLDSVELSANQEGECTDDDDRALMLATVRGSLFASLLWSLGISPHAKGR